MVKQKTHRWQTARRVWRSVEVTKHSTIRYVRYSFLLCNSNLKTRRFYDIRLQKYRDLEIRVSGHSRSLKRTVLRYSTWKCRDLEHRVRGPSRSLETSPFDRAHMTSYWRSIVTMALSRVVSEIFNVEKCRDLEIWVRGHSRSLKVAPFGRACMVSY